jgi:hypothetical protein
MFLGKKATGREQRSPAGSTNISLGYCLRPHPARLRRATLPLQGRVKRALYDGPFFNASSHAFAAASPAARLSASSFLT